MKGDSNRATSPAFEVLRRWSRTSFFYPFEGIETVAKVNPGEFIRQVRAEGSKVVWPSMKETRTTAIMVLIMTAMLAIFFFGVDSAFSAIVKFLLGLLG
nr:preprotein translocase subunit SecE [Sphingomonas brevis]